MSTLASLTNQQNAIVPVTIPSTGEVQIFIRGQLGPKGRVLIKLKGADGRFHAYEDLVFIATGAARAINLFSGDQLQIECVDCTAASVEVRQ